MTTETNSFETTLLRPLIWNYIHLRPRHLRPLSFETYSYETTSFETTFIWDLFIWDHIHLRLFHLRPHSFETTSFETTFVWDHIHLRLHSFQITFILRHIKLKGSCFDLLCITSLWPTFHFFAGHLTFCKVTIHFKFCKVTHFRIQGWPTLGCKCTRTSKHRRGQKTLHISGLERNVAPLKCHLNQAKDLYVLRSCPFPLSRRHNIFSFSLKN